MCRHCKDQFVNAVCIKNNVISRNSFYVEWSLKVSHINENLSSSTFFRKCKLPVSNFMKIRSAVLELLHADRRTDGWIDFNRRCAGLLAILKLYKRCYMT
jgi:hypothetical protein